MLIINPDLDRQIDNKMKGSTEQRDLLSNFSGTFKDQDLEQRSLESLWPEYAKAIRTPLIILSLFLLIGGYLDYFWYQFTPHFFAFFGLRFSVVCVGLFAAYLTLKPERPKYFFALLGTVQLYILSFYFGIFYDRMYLNENNITSETFFTVLFVTFPLVACYVIPSKVWMSLSNSLLALVAYLGIIVINPDIELQYRITELLCFLFSIYYSYNLQKGINKDKRLRYLYEVKQKEAVAMARKESQDKSRFIASTSHDLRQPLHSLTLYADLLADKLADSPHQELVNKARHSINSLHGLLGALLDVSKLDAGTVEFNQSHFSLSNLLHKLVQTHQELAAQKGLKLKWVNNSAVIHSDAVMLERVFGNLLSNAIQHVASGTILLGARKKGDAIEIQVWDQGPGIPEQELSNIFDEFKQLENPERNRNKGLGLGLAIVRRICEKLNLKLNVNSWLGKGTVFSVTVPLGKPEKVVLVTKPKENTNWDMSNARVLVIDDDQMILEAMSNLLESWGCEVIVAENCDEAVSKARQSHPHLIISDYRLPGHQNGGEVIQRINEQFDVPRPAVILTGDTSPERVISAQASGHLLLHKPVKAAQLRMALRKLSETSTLG